MPLEFSWPLVGLAAALGLVVGSFLNVLIYRLPRMLEREWARESALHLSTEVPHHPPLNLFFPRSHCPHCEASIRWYDNIPLVSYVVLRGKCAHCHHAIGLRYPAIEGITAVIFALCAVRWGLTPTAGVWCIWGSALLALACIDWDTHLLPDSIVLPLLWLGLLSASWRWTSVALDSAVWGAALGYFSLWLVFWCFKWVTGKEGMGYGDFKLFACLGAWFGWPMLLPIVLMASVAGSLVGIALKLSHRLGPGEAIPFGPFLVGAGFIAMGL
jgi:leader peptidase (prepilin peptidase)/N-methyltransferase